MITLPPETAAAASPALSLRLFGSFIVTVQGLPMPKIRSQKERWLLALLALHAPTPLERSWLAATLWPETTDEAALYNLRRTLRFLRDALGPEADRLRSPTPRTLRLDLDGVDCDVAAFDAAVRRGDPASLAEAAALYTGPLLLGCPEEWALPEREARERAALGALEALAADAQARGDWAQADARLRRALGIDPLRETALRALLRTLAAQGCHAAATDVYRAFRRRVRDELNVELDPETAAVYRRIQEEGRRVVPPAPLAPAPMSARHESRLPMPLTPLIGRAGEIPAVVAALKQSRLVTLTGPGGVGKTRLALAVAHSLQEELGGGAWFADLAPLVDPSLLTAALMSTFGLREGPGNAPDEVLADFLRDKQLLLVLDNCEHLVGPCAHLALGLLKACPSLRILATSREALRLPGEATRPVPGLPLSEATRLFAERATQSNPAFRLTPTGAETVADICRRLDGIPLAIEMAAARTRALSLAQIAVRLGDAFRLLTEPGGDLLPRHQTLRAVLDWSYDLLTTEEKTLLARLSVFAGGWSLEAAEAVCADARIAASGVLDLLASLVDKSLVVYGEQPDGTGRYRLLETVRQYARDRLAESGGADEIRGRAAAWFLAMAEEAEPHLMGPEQASWLERLELEHDNLRASLSWYRQSATQAGQTRDESAVEGLRLAGALWRFWLVRGYYSEGRQWLDETLNATAVGGDTASELRGKAFNGAGNIACYQGDYASARTLFEGGLAIRRQRGDQRGIAASVNNLGSVAERLGDGEAARVLFAESLAILRHLGDQQGIAAAISNLAIVAERQGDLEAARALHEESLGIQRDLGDQHAIANALNGLGNVVFHQQDFGAARTLYEESLAVRRQLGEARGVAQCLNNLGGLAVQQGDFAAARALYGESLSIERQTGNRHPVALGLVNMAAVAHGQGRLSTSARLMGVSAILLAALGTSLSPADRQDVDTQVASVRASLGDTAFAAAWQEGASLTWEQAVDLALSDDD